jgi:hypothetical protein
MSIVETLENPFIQAKKRPADGKCVSNAEREKYVGAIEEKLVKFARINKIWAKMVKFSCRKKN